jgi:hypothetical protein
MWIVTLLFMASAMPLYAIPKMIQKSVTGPYQSPAIEIVRERDRIAEIQSPSLTTQSRELSLNHFRYKKKHVKKRDPKLSQVKYVSVRTDYHLGNAYQLGNQLFCIATALAYAWDNNFIPVFPFLNEPGGNRTYNRDYMFFRLDASLPRMIKEVYYDMSWQYNPIPIYPNDVMLMGPFSSWKYFHHHREELLKVLAPSPEVLDYLHAKYADLIANPNTVGVHVRTANKNVHPYIPFLGLDYFGLAMDHFSADSLFVVFSDRIGWCKKNFSEKFPDRKFIFIEENDHIQDLFLLSMMKNHILSNSTYSWWGAYLNTNPEQRVCVPDKWLVPRFNVVVDDFYMPQWIKIEHEFFKEPYPIDMYWYDEKSQSLDNPSNDQ